MIERVNFECKITRPMNFSQSPFFVILNRPIVAEIPNFG